MASNQVSLDILVQIQKALADVATFQAEATKSTQAVADSFGSLKTVGEAALAFLAVDKIAGYFTESIRLAGEQQTTLAVLNQSMANTGSYSVAASADMKAFADQIQATTTFSNQAVLSQLAIAKGFGLTNDKSKELVQGAVQLTAAMNGKYSLNESLLLIQKTLSGTLVRLGEQFPALKAFSKEQLQAGAAAKFFSDGLAGAAENLTNTYEGAVAQASNEQADFRRELGGIVTDNPAAIAALHALAAVFKEMKSAVADNHGELSNWAGDVIKVTAYLTALGATITKGPILAFEGLIVYGSEALTGLVDGAIALATVFQDTFGVVDDAILDMLSLMIEVAGKVPGVSQALQAAGIDTDDLSSSVDKLRESYDKTNDAAIKGFTDTRDKLREFSSDSVDNFYSINKGYDDVTKTLQDGAQKVIDADASTDASAKLHYQNRHGYASQAIVDLKAIAEEQKAAAELEKKLNQDQLNQLSPADKADAEWKSALTDIDKYVHDGVISWQRGEEDKELATSTHVDKIKKIQQDQANQGKELIDGLVLTNATGLDKIDLQYDQQLDHIQKLEDEQKISHQAALDAMLEADKNYQTQRNELLSQDPTQLITATGDISGADAAAAGIGVLADAVQGAQGAAHLIAQTASTIANVILPGIGGAIAGIVGVLEQGPDATKQFIEQFIQAIPEIMSAVGASMPEVVDGFIASLSKKETWVAIGNMLIDGVTGGIRLWLPQVGKDLGVNFGDSLNSPNFSKTVHGWFSGVEQNFGKLSAANFAKGIQGAGKEIERIPGLISSEIFTKLPGQIRSGFDAALVDLRREVLAIPGELRSFFTSEVPKALTGSFGSVEDFFKTQVGGFLKAGGDEIGASVRNTFGLIEKDFSQTFASVLNPIRQALASFRFPVIPTPTWLTDFENAVHNLTNWQIPGTGGGGGGGGELGKLASDIKPPHFNAVGLTEVPPGYQDDNYVTGLTSGERVVDAGTNSDLKRFLSGQDDTAALLGKILVALQQPQSVPVQLKVGTDVLATAMLKVSRTNQRVSA